MQPNDEIERLRAELAAERQENEWHRVSKKEQANVINSLVAERDTLREALKPFALMATELEYEGSKWLDHETHWLKCFDFQLEPTVGDLRRASAALKGDDRD